jgi:hypothetical protein
VTGGTCFMPMRLVLLSVIFGPTHRTVTVIGESMRSGAVVGVVVAS